MSYIEAIVLGITQGLTEFLPVSSSGHLALGHMLFARKTENLAFDILVHGATLLVVVVAFRQRLIALVREHPRVLITVAISLIPTAIVGLSWRLELAELATSPWALSASFGVTGLFLWVHEPFSPKMEELEKDDLKDANRSLGELSPLRAFTIGLSQALAITPGVSRSGLTITTGRLCGLSADQAVAFSFIMGAPAILGALLIEARDIGQMAQASPGPMVAGFLAALLAGTLSMGLLKWIAGSGNLSKFAPYCFLLAGICLIMGAAGR